MNVLRAWLRRLMALIPEPRLDFAGTPVTLLGRAAALPPALLLTGASSVFAALSLWSMSGDTSTYDEGVHLAAAYSYAQIGDYRLNPEHPPLAKLLAALPLLLMDLHWPKEPEAWRNAREWDFGYRFLYLSGNDPDRLLFWGRAPTLLWGLLLIGSVYALTRDLYGPPGAFVALVLVSFSPTVLAHSHLITTDVIVAVLFFLSVTAFWKLFQEGSYRWCVYTGFLLGGALAAKFSAILLIPLGLWMGVVAALRWRDRPPASWVGTALQWAINLAIVAALAGLTLWGTYGFRQGVSPDRSYEFDWKAMESVAGGFGGQAVLWAADQGFLPDAYAYGYFHVQKHAAGGHPSFALGRYSQTGWWWYFPFAFLVKTPAGTLALMGWGVLAAVDRMRVGKGRESFIIVALILYWVLVMRNTINIGVRHILPVYPLLTVLAGGIELSAPRPAQTIRLCRVAGAFLLLGVLEGTSAAPHFLAHFNMVPRVLFDRHEMLVDSNLDWGQDLGRLKRYVDREGLGEIKLSYFGHGSPRHFGLRHQTLSGNNSYTHFEKEWQMADPLKPGDIVAISASNYAGFLLEDKDFYRRRFRNLEPIATIGHSILIYRITEGFK